MRDALRQIMRELLIGAVVFAVATLAVAGSYAGPELALARATLERRHPAVVFVGNSTTHAGIDEAVAAEALGARVVKLWGNSSGTALWWLLLKNVVVKATPTPRLAFLLYRDHELTNPSLGIEGEPGMQVAATTSGAEPELDELAYRPALGPLHHLAYRYWPLWRARDSAPTLLDRFVRQRVLGPLFGYAKETSDVAYWNVLGDKRMDRARLTAYQFRADDVILDSELDFDAQVERSFLPRMVEITRAAGVKLVLVRQRTRRDALGDPVPARNRRYGEETAAWCARNGVPLLDFRGDATLTADLFGFGDHLTEEGARFFTRKLCAAIRPPL